MVNTRSTSDDVRGAGAFTDLATNLLLVNRCVERAEALEKETAGEFLTPAERDLLDEKSDLEVQIRKQKFGSNYNGVLNLWYGNGMTFKDARWADDVKLNLRTVEGFDEKDKIRRDARASWRDSISSTQKSGISLSNLRARLFRGVSQITL